MSRQLTSGVLGRKKDFSYLIDNLIAGYRLDGDGSDISSNSNDLVIDPALSFVTGKVNQCLEYNRNGGAIPTSNIFLPAQSDWCISSWIYINSSVQPETQYSYMGKRRAYEIVFTTGGDIRFEIRASNEPPDSRIYTYDSALFDFDSWIHTTMNYKANDVAECFINGKLVGTINTVGITAFDRPNFDFWVGTIESPRYVDGKIDEAYVFNKSLSQEEIKGIMKGI